MLSTPKLIITTAMKSASMTLTKPENYLGDVTARHSLTPHQYPTHSAKFASPTLGFPAQSSSALNYKTGKQNRFLLADTPSTHALNKIGRASCRERVEISEGGGRRNDKPKKWQ